MAMACSRNRGSASTAIAAMPEAGQFAEQRVDAPLGKLVFHDVQPVDGDGAAGEDDRGDGQRVAEVLSRAAMACSIPRHARITSENAAAKVKRSLRAMSKKREPLQKRGERRPGGAAEDSEERQRAEQSSLAPPHAHECVDGQRHDDAAGGRGFERHPVRNLAHPPAAAQVREKVGEDARGTLE